METVIDLWRTLINLDNSPLSFHVNQTRITNVEHQHGDSPLIVFLCEITQKRFGIPLDSRDLPGAFMSELARVRQV